MPETLSGYRGTTVLLSSSSSYANPGSSYGNALIISGTVEANPAVYIQSPWSLTVTGTLADDFFLAIHAAASAAIANSGLILAPEFDGIDLAAGGSINNSGSIYGGLHAIYGSSRYPTDVYNSGRIQGGETGLQSGYGAITNSSTGTISGASAAVSLTQAATIANAGLLLAGADAGTGIFLAAGGLIANTGTITAYTGLTLYGGTLQNSGFIEGETAAGASLQPSAFATAIRFTAPGTFIAAGGVVLGSISGDGGVLALTGGAVSQIYGFAQDRFAPGADALLTAPARNLGLISGFAPGDEIVLEQETAGSGIFLDHALTLSDGTTLAFAGSYASAAFSVYANADGNTDIALAIPCFCAGTRIATPQGEVAVERLRIGDPVSTLHAGPQPIKFIGTRSYDGRFIAGNRDILPIRIAAGALARNRPARDLYLSPGHGVLCAGTLIPAAQLLNASSITQLASVDSVAYFHIELATHEILFAESLPVESFLGAEFRGQFHNAAEFSRLYPDSPPLTPCLERTEHGFLLHALNRRLGAPAPSGTGRLRGCIDRLGPDRISGWAQNIAAPEDPVCLDILAAGHRLARLLANEYRADLRQAGLGSGRHGFSCIVPNGIIGPFTIRRSWDFAPLASASFSKPFSARPIQTSRLRRSVIGREEAKRLLRP